MTDTTRPGHAAEERVKAFMAEFEAQWRIAAPAFEKRGTDRQSDPFKLWGELMAQTKQNHFTDSSGVNFSQSFSQPAEHGAEAEELVRSEVQGGVAYVLTRCTPPPTSFNEYTLHAQDADWKISSIATHYGEPTQPFVDRATIEDHLLTCSADAPFTEMPREEALLDEARNFTEREVRRDDGAEPTRTQVSRIGTLVTSTGALSVRDFGYENDDARPLTRTVAPGAYPVERVLGFGRNAAVRVRFSEMPPVSWHPAADPRGGHVIGVDTGTVCIVDYVAYAAMTRREKVAAYERFTEASRPAAAEIPLGGADVGLAFDSGYGDGGYPVYWGVDAQGSVAQLVVDFMILADQDDDGVLTHL